jgi:ketosteroid isomerase-like protein
MKKSLSFVLLVSALCLGTQGVSADPAESEFRTFLQRWEEAQARFLTGDPTLWKQNASQRDDVTILGGFGGYEKGWAQVGPRYDWAASQYKAAPARVKLEYVSTIVTADLAFTIAIERQEEVGPSDQRAAAPRVLRATQIFRKEDGAWKLLHRHADPFTEKKAPSAGAVK